MKKNYGIEDVIELLKPYRTDEKRESYLFTEEQGNEILAQCPETAYILWENGYFVDFDSQDNTIVVVRWSGLKPKGLLDYIRKNN